MEQAVPESKNIPRPANENRTEGTELQSTSAEMHRGIAKSYEVYKYIANAHLKLLQAEFKLIENYI